VLDHCPAFLGAIAARLRTGRHALVAGNFLARHGAFVAALCARLQHKASDGALPGTQGCTAFATLGTVGAELCRLGVFLLALSQQRHAMRETRVALELTVSAGFGALRKVLGMFVHR